MRQVIQKVGSILEQKQIALEISPASAELIDILPDEPNDPGIVLWKEDKQ